MPITESQFAIINVIRIEKPVDFMRFVYYDIEGENGGSVQIACNPEDSETVFWQRVENTLTVIAQKYYPNKNYQFANVSFPNPDSVVAFAQRRGAL